eukprot:m.381481 g.381481  ORF g.381481 m.381481 type:complete len:109 (+) comp20042_c0_seq33:3947-4273(+)
MAEANKDTGEVFNPAALRFNFGRISYMRTSAAIVSGCSSGILGLSGLYGFAFYLFASLVLSALLYVHEGDKVLKHFTDRSSILYQDVPANLFTYILFWTLLYAAVHVY